MTNNDSKFWEEPEEEFNLKFVLSKYTCAIGTGL